MQRILANTKATLRAQFIDQYGSSDPSITTASVFITNANGVVANGSAVQDPGVDGGFTFDVSPADTAVLDRWTATWVAGDGTTVVTEVDIAGGFYFTIDEARAIDPTLQKVEKYPTEDVARARQEVETHYERIGGQVFVPRYRRAVLDGSGTAILQLPDNDISVIRSLNNYGAIYSSDQLAALLISPYGELTYGNYAGIWLGYPNAVTIEYEYGRGPVPADLKSAMINHCRYVLNSFTSGIPDRAQSWTSGDGGTYSIAQAGEDRIGIPEIDAVYGSYTRSVPVIA